MPGRPKHLFYDIKKNKTRWTIRPTRGDNWKFLPFRGTVSLKTFLLDVDATWNPREDLSKLIRGEIITVKIPENRAPHFRPIYRKGAEANPYKPYRQDIRKYVVEAAGDRWPVGPGLTFSNLYSQGQFTGDRSAALPRNSSPRGDLVFDAENGYMLFEVLASGKRRAIEYDMDGYDTGPTRKYTCRFMWGNWDRLLAEYQRRMKSTHYFDRGIQHFEDFSDALLYKVPVQIDCSCGAFHWQGIKEVLRRNNIAINDNRYSVGKKQPYRNLDKIDTKVPLCKHLYWVMQFMFKRGSLAGQKEDQFKHKLKNYLDRTYGFLMSQDEPGQEPTRPDIRKFLDKQKARRLK